jgi:DNA-binding beta-propeller fold protein YncE
LPYTGLGRAVDAAADTAGNLYVTDDAKNRVLKLAPGTVSPIVLPFTDLNVIAGVAVDPTGNVYVSDGLHFRILKLPVQ